MVTVTEPPYLEDELSLRFSTFIDHLTSQLGDSAVVSRKFPTPKITVTSIEPTNHLACPVSIAELGDKEWVLSVSRGGRWEAARTLENLVLIESLVTAAIEGHVSETIRPGGARVAVTTGDGKLHKSGVQSTTMLFFAERKNWYRRHDFAPFK